MNFNSKRVIAPMPLKAGDTIGIVAPAGPFDRDRFSQGIDKIHASGFYTKIDDVVYERHGYLAGEDSRRAAHFNAVMADETVQAVMCARGGYGAIRILDLLNYDVIARHPKPLIGFSDITALHKAIHLRTGLITFHGPMVTTISSAEDETQQSWHDMLTGECDFDLLSPGIRILKKGAAEGRLAGGNLATLCHLLGTSYGGDYAGNILLIEDVGEAPYRLDRMLTQMLMAGVLDGIAGLLVGSFEDCGSAEEIDALVMDRFQSHDIPILSGLPIGHGKDNITVPLGAKIRVDTRGPEITLVERVFQ